MATFIGIDPGAEGAVACVRDDGEISVADTPTVEIKGTRKEYLVGDMAALLRGIKAANHGKIIAVLEEVHAMPKQGVVAVGSLMRGLGLWEGVLAGLDIPFVKVPPVGWKKDFGLVSPATKGVKKGDFEKLSKKQQKEVLAEKETARRKRQVENKAKAVVLAQRLFPTAELRLKKHHGRAEALLMAEYAKRQYHTVPDPKPSAKALRPL